MKRFASILALSGLVACDSTVKSASYASVSEVQRDSAVERGWIPSWIPHTSRAILETHDLDTSVSSLRLSFSLKEGWSIPDTCTKVTADELPKPRLKPSWWPRGVPSAKGGGASFVYFRCRSDSKYLFDSLAIDGKNGELLYWRSYAA